MTAADSSGARLIDTAPESASRPANPSATARRRVSDDAQLPVGHGAQPRQIVVVDEFGGERQHRPLAPVEQDRLAAAQRDDRRVEHPPPDDGSRDNSADSSRDGPEDSPGDCDEINRSAKALTLVVSRA